jgi:hypothetical protein
VVGRLFLTLSALPGSKLNDEFQKRAGRYEKGCFYALVCAPTRWGRTRSRRSARLRASGRGSRCVLAAATAGLLPFQTAGAEAPKQPGRDALDDVEYDVARGAATHAPPHKSILVMAAFGRCAGRTTAASDVVELSSGTDVDVIALAGRPLRGVFRTTQARRGPRTAVAVFYGPSRCRFCFACATDVFWWFGTIRAAPELDHE